MPQQHQLYRVAVKTDEVDGHISTEEPRYNDSICPPRLCR